MNDESEDYKGVRDKNMGRSGGYLFFGPFRCPLWRPKRTAVWRRLPDALEEKSIAKSSGTQSRPSSPCGEWRSEGICDRYDMPSASPLLSYDHREQCMRRFGAVQEEHVASSQRSELIASLVPQALPETITQLDGAPEPQSSGEPASNLEGPPRDNIDTLDRDELDNPGVQPNLYENEPDEADIAEANMLRFKRGMGKTDEKIAMNDVVEVTTDTIVAGDVDSLTPPQSLMNRPPAVQPLLDEPEAVRSLLDAVQADEVVAQLPGAVMSRSLENAPQGQPAEANLTAPEEMLPGPEGTSFVQRNISAPQAKQATQDAPVISNTKKRKDRRRKAKLSQAQTEKTDMPAPEEALPLLDDSESAERDTSALQDEQGALMESSPNEGTLNDPQVQSEKTDLPALEEALPDPEFDDTAERDTSAPQGEQDELIEPENEDLQAAEGELPVLEDKNIAEPDTSAPQAEQDESVESEKMDLQAPEEGLPVLEDDNIAEPDTSASQAEQDEPVKAKKKKRKGKKKASGVQTEQVDTPALEQAAPVSVDDNSEEALPAKPQPQSAPTATLGDDPGLGRTLPPLDFTKPMRPSTNRAADIDILHRDPAEIAATLAAAQAPTTAYSLAPDNSSEIISLPLPRPRPESAFNIATKRSVRVNTMPLSRPSGPSEKSVLHWRNVASVRPQAAQGRIFDKDIHWRQITTAHLSAFRYAITEGKVLDSTQFGPIRDCHLTPISKKKTEYIDGKVEEYAPRLPRLQLEKVGERHSRSEAILEGMPKKDATRLKNWAKKTGRFRPEGVDQLLGVAVQPGDAKRAVPSERPKRPKRTTGEELQEMVEPLDSIDASLNHLSEVPNEFEAARAVQEVIGKLDDQATIIVEVKASVASESDEGSGDGEAGQRL